MSLITTQFIPGPRLIDGTDLNNLVAQVNNAISAIGPISGPTYFVNSTLGVDMNNNGQNPARPLATLGQALALESAALTAAGLSSVGRNAVVAFWGTQHLSATLAWNLPATHLIGISNGLIRGKRARISPSPALAGTAGFNYLVQVTAQGCLFSNFQAFYGFSNTAAALVAWYDTAGHSAYNNVEVLGFGDGTVSTGTANLTGARAFKFNSNVGESIWQNCVFGVDTETRNATNYTLEIAGNAPRLSFIDCDFEAYLGSSGTAGSHLLIGAAGIDRYMDLVRCRFHNALNSGASAMAQAFNINAAPGGTIFLDQCTFDKSGITAIETSPASHSQMNMVASTTTGGLTHTVF